MAFTNFSAFMRQEFRTFTPGEVMSARGLLSLALASFAYPELTLPKRLDRNITVVPGTRAIDFFVPTTFGGRDEDVEFEIDLDQFNIASYAEEGEFLAFRAFIDEVRHLPPTPGADDATTTIGHFAIYTSPNDMAKWDKLWAVWEHAHGQ